ncbi:leukemia inhibitory factor receptor isoform X2 [Clupea harengus]|uniref:Leukemia inhibitory factor receptor isoform X2 n=1 Tax=Clupea harengus TaxID=7950 RepID=A0A6P8FS83_CLUHA|nr:leukemia inhibitory factor receptor isoform X2 [Clupea harengus]XP_042564191.1 leukemia inhibitory factor receptor isoform X2 [Clupea harengus]
MSSSQQHQARRTGYSISAMDQALWHISLLLIISCENGWNRGFDFVDSVPVQFQLYPQDHQRLVVNWTADSTVPDVTYEIQVTRTNTLNVIESINVSIRPQEFGESFHTWTWTSKLPLQCTDHSVRMRTVYNSTFVGNWSQWKTHLGVHEYQDQVWREPQMFPSEEVLQERSEVHFCCVAPRDAQVINIIFNNTQYPLINIGSQVKAIAVDNLNITSDLGVIFQCLDSNEDENITANFVSFPPQKPRNLSCETEDLKLWSCKWDPGRLPNLHHAPYNYTLLVKNSGRDLIWCETSSCSFLVFSHLHEYNVTVMVTSILGQKLESIRFNALDRVFPVAKSLSMRPGVTEASLSWTIEGNFTKILVICQVQMNPEGTVMDIEQIVGLVLHFACQLKNLKPSTQYSVKVRCAVSGKRWGKWSDPQFFTTYPLVDIWRSIQALPSGRSVIVTWRTYASGTQLDVKSYEVQLQQENKLEKLCTNTWLHQTEFLIDERGCNISVRAITRAGTSAPSHILIPPAERSENNVIVKRIVGSTGTGFMLLWIEDASAMCGYTIEWCQNGTGVLPCNPSNLRWETVHQSNTSLSLRAGAFISGRRYTFNVFGCRVDGHHLIDTHVGYLQEQKPTQFTKIQDSPVVTSSSAIITWTFPEDHPLHPGFITGYLVTVQDGQGSNQNHTYTISVDNPHRKTITVNSLMENKEYTYYIQACTSVGPGPPTHRRFRTSPDYSLFWVKIVIPMAFLFGCCTLLYWTRLRNTVVEIFTHPTKVNVKIVELDSCLYEMSKRIGALRVEDCMCCDLEIIDVRPGMAERKFMICPNDAGCSSVHPTEHCYSTELLDDVCDDPVSDSSMNVCNFTYSPTITEVSFCRSSFSSDGLIEGQPVPPHSTCIKGYVTSAVVPT